MYQKPELTLVGNAVDLVLGDTAESDDSEHGYQSPPHGLVQGLDD
jgi:hypothetical protein